MAEETKPQEGNETEPYGGGQEPDYKALYEAEKAHSRKWEKQAKANRSAADELEKAREAGKTAEEQVEGYDPDGMLDRWHECQAAAGGDSDFREEWRSMSKKERARYKGGSDAERYRRFVNAKAMREVETRDWRWLYTGEVPKETYQSSRARDELNATEKLTCKILRENGFKQHVLERSNEHGKKTADILLGASEIRTDYKTPRGNGFNSID